MKLTKKQTKILRKIVRATINLIGLIGALGIFIVCPILAGESNIPFALQASALLGTGLISAGCIKIYNYFMS